MKNLINKSLRIVAIIAMMISVGNANKDETPILQGDGSSIYILPRDYITIHSITMGKQNGDCKMNFDNITFKGNPFSDNRSNKKLGEKLSWVNMGSISFSDYGKLCRPDSDENKNVKYIIVLTTNFGSYVYEYINANYEKAKADKNQKNGYILPLIDYKK